MREVKVRKLVVKVIEVVKLKFVGKLDVVVVKEVVL